MNRSMCRSLLRAIPRQPNTAVRALKPFGRPLLLRQYASATSHPASDPPTAEELANNRDYFFDKDGNRRVTVDFEYPGKFYLKM